MSSYMKAKIHCQCCGTDFEGKILKGFYNSFPADMDGFPHNPAIFDIVVICPECGYATDRIHENVDWPIASLVHSEKYQEIVSSDLPESCKKELLNAMLKKEKGRYHEAAQSYLRLYWNRRESGVYDKVALAEAIQCFSQYLEEHMDIDTAIVLVDCQRQYGDFAGAAETAQSLLPYVREPKLIKLVEFEQRLISNQDTQPHSRREAAL